MLNLKELLNSGLSKLNLILLATTKDKILDYIELLIRWNQIHNLTAIREPQAILIRHIFDSLAILPFITGPEILDFGSGAGLPGIPLALALPNWQFVLIDSSRKKTTFLNHLVLTLAIKNIQVITARVEEFRFASGFATIVTRATDKTEAVISKTKHLLSKTGQLLIMKGKNLKELATINKEQIEIFPILVPYLQEKRQLVRVQQL